jgi:hypothetical protein
MVVGTTIDRQQASPRRRDRAVLRGTEGAQAALERRGLIHKETCP